MIFRTALVCCALLAGLWEGTANAQDIPFLPTIHVGLRAGYFAGVQKENNPSGYAYLTDYASPYGMSGRGLSLGAILTVGGDNFRWLNKIENMAMIDPDEWDSPSSITLITSGAQYNSAKDGSLGLILEASLGAAIAHGRMVSTS
jgi:hypothetical protein